MLRQRADLGALQVGVGRHDRLDVLAGALEQRLLQPPQPLVLALDHAPQVQAHVGHDLVVAAASRVQLGAGLADELRQAALDRHVHVFVGVVGCERAASISAATPARPFSIAASSGSVRTPARVSARAWRHRALDVLAPQTPV